MATIQAKDLTLTQVGQTVRVEYPRFRDGVRVQGEPFMGPFRIVEGFVTGLSTRSEVFDDTRICSPDEERVFQLSEVHVRIDSRETLELDPLYELEVLG